MKDQKKDERKYQSDLEPKDIIQKENKHSSKKKVKNYNGYSGKKSLFDPISHKKRGIPIIEINSNSIYSSIADAARAANERDYKKVLRAINDNTAGKKKPIEINGMLFRCALNADFNVNVLQEKIKEIV